VITSFRGALVRDAIGFIQLLEQTGPEERTDIVTIRDGQAIKLRLELEFKPRFLSDRRKLPFPDKIPKEKGYFEPATGLTIADLTDKKRSELGFDNDVEGVYVTDVASQSDAGILGIRRGMVVARVGRDPVRSVDEFKTTFNAQSLDKGVLLLVCLPYGEHFMVLRPHAASPIKWSIPVSDDGEFALEPADP
jgi:hypothetical protein